MQDVCAAIGKSGANPIVVSIAAGVTLDSLAGWLPSGCRIVRVMPNTPAMVGELAAGYAPNAACSEADAALSTDKQLRLATDKVVEQAQAIHALRQELEAVRAQLAATPPGPPTAPRRSPSARQPPDAAAGRKVDAKTLATEEANAAAALQAKLEEETTRARDAMRQRLHLRKRRRETMTAAKAHL